MKVVVNAQLFCDQGMRKWGGGQDSGVSFFATTSCECPPPSCGEQGQQKGFCFEWAGERGREGQSIIVSAAQKQFFAYPLSLPLPTMYTYTMPHPPYPIPGRHRLLCFLLALAKYNEED